MGKRMVALLACMVMIAAMGACGVVPDNTVMPSASDSPVVSATPTATTAGPTSTASPTATPVSTKEQGTLEPEPTEEPEITEDPDLGDEEDYTPEYSIPGMKATGLTNKQYDRIRQLLSAALAMSGSGDHPAYFNDARTLKPAQLFTFLVEAMYDPAAIDLGKYKQNKDFDYLIGKSAVEALLRSAFHINYISKYAGDRESCLFYRNGIYTYTPPQGSEVVPHELSIKRISSKRIQIKLDIIFDGDASSYFKGKAYAVFEEDQKSIYGYHMVSLTRIKSAPSFANVTASSWLPRASKKTFVPKNSIDGNIKTGWSIKRRKGDWLKLSSTKMQTVSGIMIFIGDRSHGDEVNMGEASTMVKIELSDGSSFDCELWPVFNAEETQAICFDRDTKTQFIKITIVDPGDKDTYIAEVRPF